MFLIPYPGSYFSLFVQGQWTRCGEAIDPRESYVTQGASVAYTWVVGRDPLVDRLGSVSSNRKSFEKMGPPFEVDHFSRSDRLEFWLNGSRP